MQHKANSSARTSNCLLCINLFAQRSCKENYFQVNI